MPKILIKNARIIDPANELDEVKDMLISGKKISQIGKDKTLNDNKNTNIEIDKTIFFILPLPCNFSIY